MTTNLRQNRRRLEDKFFIAAFEDSDEAIITLDQAQCIYSVSKGASLLLDWPPAELTGKPFSSLILTPSDQHLLLPGPGKALRHAPVTLSNRGNQKIDVQITIEPLIETDSNRAIGYLCWLWPKSSSPELNLENRLLRETFLRLQRLGTIGQVTASFAHQMRSPLQIIQSQAEYALEFGALSDELKNNLNTIVKHSQRLARLVDSVLNMAKSGTCQLGPAQIENVLESALMSLESSVKQKRIRVKKSFQPCPLLDLDPPLLQGAFYNLLSNAVEAMPQEGTLSVSIVNTHQVTVTIQDTGTGISPAIEHQIGEPFFSTKSSGTGLGVYMARQIIEQHHAALTLESLPGQGVTAIIKFKIP